MRAAQIAVEDRLSRPALAVLYHLVQDKLGCMEVFDRDDARERKGLEHARTELLTLLGKQLPAPSKPVRALR